MQNTFLRKSYLLNVGKIDTWSQFHQHFKSRICTHILLPKKLQSQIICRGKLQKHFCVKSWSKMFAKLTLAVNFISAWFSYKIIAPKISNPKYSFQLYKSFATKTRFRTKTCTWNVVEIDPWATQHPLHLIHLQV